jgi:hypothetical protein
MENQPNLEDFFEFTKPLQIFHPAKGLVPLEIYPFQKRFIETIHENKYLIGTKFRQGGFTTFSILYGYWIASLGFRAAVVSKTDRECLDKSYQLARIVEHAAVQPSRKNQHGFFFENGGRLDFLTTEASRGKAIQYLFIDEMAFFSKQEQIWQALFPSVVTGNKCVIMSTTNGVGNWFETTYRAAERGENDFRIFTSDYWEHPDYNNQDWVELIRHNLGEKAFNQEILQNFVAETPNIPGKKVIGDFFDSLSTEDAIEIIQILKEEMKRRKQ